MNESQNSIEIYKAIIDEQVKNTMSIASKLIIHV